jgi:single-stranded DNA-specific DHH superfamily exonuclease
MERAFDQLDAAEFLAIWHHFDADGEDEVINF